MNYPWFNYGRNLGISVVRWFILADGLTCGSDNEAPRSDGSFEPPTLDATHGVVPGCRREGSSLHEVEQAPRDSDMTVFSGDGFQLDSMRD